jgi:hypothetical protein
MIFYVSYLACEFPHAYGMQTLPTAKYLGTMVALVSQTYGKCTLPGMLINTGYAVGHYRCLYIGCEELGWSGNDKSLARCLRVGRRAFSHARHRHVV